MKKVLIGVMLASLMVGSPLAMAKTAPPAANQVTIQTIKESMVINKKDVRSARVVKGTNNSYLIAIQLKPEAAKNMTRMSGANLHGKMMMTIGDHVINRATIQSKLGANFQITGASKPAAEKIVAALS
jgi:preprotein translocase subunit SecD